MKIYVTNLICDRVGLIFVKDGIWWMIKICEKKIVLTHEKGGLKCCHNPFSEK